MSSSIAWTRLKIDTIYEQIHDHFHEITSIFAQSTIVLWRTFWRGFCWLCSLHNSVTGNSCDA